MRKEWKLELVTDGMKCFDKRAKQLQRVCFKGHAVARFSRKENKKQDTIQ
jgi:hypothetical protein